MKLSAGQTETSITEFYLVGLECYEDFDRVLEQLILLDVKVEHTLDGIYSRTATVEKEGTTFAVIYHEDVGIYSFILGQQSPTLNDGLKEILEKVTLGINSRNNPLSTIEL